VRIRVDTELCSGHARCNAAAPDIFELDDAGYNAMDDHDIADDHVRDASRGVLACPERAITMLDADGERVPEGELRRLAGLDS
jgi:ferredoxin